MRINRTLIDLERLEKIDLSSGATARVVIYRDDGAATVADLSFDGRSIRHAIVDVPANEARELVPL
jgi:hypothetical protein